MSCTRSFRSKRSVSIGCRLTYGNSWRTRAANVTVTPGDKACYRMICKCTLTNTVLTAGFWNCLFSGGRVEKASRTSIQRAPGCQVGRTLQHFRCLQNNRAQIFYIGSTTHHSGGKKKSLLSLLAFPERPTLSHSGRTQS